MIPTAIIKTVFYVSILSSIIWHIMLIFAIIRCHISLQIAFDRSDKCKSKQLEGETVRFAALNIKSKYGNYFNKTTAISIGSIFTTFIIAIIVISSRTTNDAIILNDQEIMIGIFIILLLWIDAIFVTAITNHKISRQNDDYKKRMDIIVTALSSIYKKYPIYETKIDQTYPTEVKRLFSLILKRWVNKNNEATMDDGINSMIDLTNNNQFNIIYEYIKFEKTLEDHTLIQTAYDNYCALTDDQKGTDKKCTTGLESALNSLQTYEPSKIYKNYYASIGSYILASVMLLSPFLFIIFHSMYLMLGPGLLGVIIILLSVIAVCIGYYTQYYTNEN